MNTIKFIIVVSIVLLGTDLIYHQVASAQEKGKAENLYFSVNIPDNWAYSESSNTPQSQTIGFGPVNSMELTPNEFSEFLLIRDAAKLEKIEDGGAFAQFTQDTVYRIKNAPLESYVKYKIDNLGILNITSQQYTTVGKEKSVRLDANELASFGNNTKGALYFVMHDKQPYAITFYANTKNYEKYLPEFEQMVKSFRFVDNFFGSTETDNETETKTNETNTKTNFSTYISYRPYLEIGGISLTPDLSKQIGLNQTKGFLLTNITKGSPAGKAGLRAGSTTTTYNGRDVEVGGDIILKIDNSEVSKIDDIKAYLSQKHVGDKAHLTILRDNAIKELDLTLGKSPIQPTSQNGDNKNEEELYNECVRVAGQSLCDFLFKR